jgi:hypothetical protein
MGLVITFFITEDETGILSGIKLEKLFACFRLRICFGNGIYVQVRREVKVNKLLR